MRRSIVVLMLYLLLFGVLFIVSLYNYFNNVMPFDIGFSVKMTNIIILGLCFLGIIKSVWHLVTF
jgi:hypothetical protein